MTTHEKKEAKNAAQRKRDERIRKRAAGLVPKEIWCTLEEWELIKKFIDNLRKKISS